MDKACLKHFEEHKRKTNVTRLYLFFFVCLLYLFAMMFFTTSVASCKSSSEPHSFWVANWKQKLGLQKKGLAFFL